MAFEQLGLNYAVEYSAALANAYPYLSYFSQIWAAPIPTPISRFGPKPS